MKTKCRYEPETAKTAKQGQQDCCMVWMCECEHAHDCDENLKRCREFAEQSWKDVCRIYEERTTKRNNR